jgi:hypothetical protein
LPESGNGRAWQDDAVDSGGDHDAEADFGDARGGDVEGVVGAEGAGNADDSRRVAGQDKRIGREVSRVLRAEGAKPDPYRERAEEQDALLCEASDEEQGDRGADQRADNPVEAFGENRPALLRLRDDENRQQRPRRVIEVEGESDQQGDQPGCCRLGGKDHGRVRCWSSAYLNSSTPHCPVDFRKGR